MRQILSYFAKQADSDHLCRIISSSFAAIAMLFSIALPAQNSKFKPEWNVGINAGYNFSSVDFDPRITTKTTGGKTGGISLRYISEKNLGLIGELNFSQQGWTQDFLENSSLYSHSHKLNYVELPVMTHIYFGKKVRFMFNFGPQISFLLSEKEEMNSNLSQLLASGSAGKVLSDTVQYGKMAERKLDYGLVMGTGVELRTKIGYFVLEGRYYFGLGDIYNSTKSDYFSRSANRVMSAKLTYYMKIF